MKYNGEGDPVTTPSAPRPSTDAGLLLMALIWGLNFPVIKVSLDQIPPLAFNALRFPLGALAVYLILRTQGPIILPHRRDWARVVFLGILGNLVYQAFFIFGLAGTFAGNASILLATTPIWTLGLSTVRGHERPASQVWIGVLATLSGMVLVVLGGTRDVGFRGTTLKGDLLMVGAAVVWSLYTVGSRRLIQTYGSLPVTAWTLWVGTIGLFLQGLPTLSRFDLGEVSPLGWVGVAYSGILAIGLAYILWYRGVREIGNSRTAAFSNLTPIVAMVVAWLWLDEAPAALQLSGAAVVLLGLTLTRLGRVRPEKDT